MSLLTNRNAKEKCHFNYLRLPLFTRNEAKKNLRFCDKRFLGGFFNDFVIQEFEASNLTLTKNPWTKEKRSSVGSSLKPLDLHKKSFIFISNFIFRFSAY